MTVFLSARHPLYETHSWDFIRHTAGTGFVRWADRKNIRPLCDLAEEGASWDALGYPMMALWQAAFIQRMEAVFPEFAN